MLTPSEHKEQVAFFERTLHALRTSEPPCCCLNCENWNTAECRKFGPVAIEHQGVAGCPKWEERLPF